ncbi:MAG TPA: phenylalanine--tRNA ligase subunit beta, partial [Thermohalobaculum sp.]|nr:phenylalanine--tRNA ligase subunit beta [Thermohalobaculum sp.]
VPDWRRSYTLDPARVISLVGMEIGEGEQVRILEALGFEPRKTAETWDVAVPSWRPDVQGEADLVEEIARVASLTRLQAQPLPRPAAGVARPTLSPMQARESRARRQLSALGLNECVTYSFVAEAAARAFGGGAEAVRLENPISSEMSHLRPDLLPGLLAAAARNQARGFGDLGLFEIGPVFHGGEPDEQAPHATALRVGHTAPRHWSGTRRPVDLHDAKADAEALLSALGVDTGRLMVAREAPAWFHPGRSAVLKLGPKNPLAVFGELHPRALEAMAMKGPAVAAIVMLANPPMPRAKGTARPALAASDLQAVERDFAFVVEEGVEAGAVLRAATGADRRLIEQAEIFDVFSGPRAVEQFGEGRKSIAVTVRLQPQEQTLTEPEIEAVAGRIVAAVEKATGGTLRR